MKISAQTRYALIGITELAINQNQTLSIAQISKRHHIPLSYLEKIFQKLRSSNLVSATRGQMGGYCLTRLASSITLREVMHSVDESLIINACHHKPTGCIGREKCLAHNFLSYVSGEIGQLFEKLTLKDLVNNQLSLSTQNY